MMRLDEGMAGVVLVLAGVLAALPVDHNIASVLAIGAFGFLAFRILEEVRR